MKKLLKYSAFGIGGLVLLGLLILAYFTITFNPNDHKQALIDLVKEKNDRTLIIDGDISFTYWPKVGANLGKVSISEQKSDKVFAAINSAKVALAVMPLLKNALVVDTIYIDGAKANIVKYKDGTTNYDDFLSKEETESQEVKFDVQGVNITDSEVTYIDELNNKQYSISQFNLESSHIALGSPVDLDTSFTVTANEPALTANTKIKGNFLYDPESKHFKVKGLDSEIQGDLFGGKNIALKATGDIDAQTESIAFIVDGLTLAITGDFDGAKQAIDVNAPSISIQKDTVSSSEVSISFKQNKAGDDLKVNMVLADMTGSAKAVQSSGITGDLAMVQGKRTVTGSFSSPFSGNVEALIFNMPKLVGQLDIKDPSLPNGAVSGTFNLAAHTDIKNENAKSKFNLVLDDTKLNGNVAVNDFKKPNIKFDLNADKLDLNKLLGAPSQSSKRNNGSAEKPADMSALNTLLLDGKINIDSIVYDKHLISGVNLGIKANGKKVAINGLNLKVNDSKIKGALSVSQFAKPLYTFDLDIDQLNLDQYVSQSDSTEAVSDRQSTGDETIDLSALKALNANGSVRIGKLNYGKTKVSNVRIDLKANDGVATLSPFSANLYEGKMKGSLKVDARATPNIAFKQAMHGVSVGPLLIDTINNDMLSGKGTVNVDVYTQGNTVNTFKKSLSGTSSLALTDGALKGVDIAGNIRDLKNKVNVFKTKNTTADETKKTDFSELTATFDIKNGVAHNKDLAMKAPILRLAKGDSKGDIDIGNERINYIAKPTIVKSLKGQGGGDLDGLSGIGIPMKITGTFSDPKYSMDFSAVATGLAQSKLLDKVGGEKGAAIKELLSGDNKIDALKGLLGKDKEAAPTTDNTAGTTPAKEPKSVKDKAKDSLKDLLKF